MFVVYRVILSVTNVDDRLQSLHQNFSRRWTTLNTSVTAIDELRDGICNRIVSQPSLLANLHNDFQRRRPSHLGRRCQQMAKHAGNLDYKSFYYQKHTVDGHKPGCPYSGRNLAKRMESSLCCSFVSQRIETTMARPQYLGWKHTFPSERHPN